MRNFEVASRRQSVETRLVVESVASRMSDITSGGWMALEALAEIGPIRNGDRGCEAELARLAPVLGFAALARTGPDGNVLCASRDIDAPIDFSDYSWFREIAEGRPRSASSLLVGPIAGVPVLVLAVDVRVDGRFAGSLSGALSAQSLRTLAIAPNVGEATVVVLDPQGQVVAAAEGEAPIEPAARAALIAAGFRKDLDPVPGLSAETSTLPASLITIAAIANAPENAAARAALTALAPLLAILLGAAGMWAALEGGVLRYFRNLEHKARAFGAGMSSQVSMEGAPPEFAHLADSLDQAFQRALERERDLERAANENRRLSRELHHRVKNNLQVVASLANRQQRRAEDPSVRSALAEARARMLAIALVHRFMDPPEHLGIIDLDAYLAELIKQLHMTLAGEARGVTLNVDISGGEAPVDFAISIGLIIAETLIAGYRGAAGFSGAQASVRWSGEAERALEVKVATSLPADALDFDVEIVRQLARQAGARLTLGRGAEARLDWYGETKDSSAVD